MGVQKNCQEHLGSSSVGRCLLDTLSRVPMPFPARNFKIKR